MGSTLKAMIVLLAAGVAIAVAIFFWVGARGVSARAQPGRIETMVAHTMRRLAIPGADRNRPNPVALSDEIIAEGMAHYADHCAACHANNGSGETEMGLGLYPKPPDMRLPATQSLTDGELFYIIENGIRLTGMPAWSTGTTEGATASWHLVHFIRRLPNLTAAELADMEAVNPRSPAEFQQQVDEERFLRGDDVAPAKPAHAH
jgi:mono/diheme cytochrome c family protein